MLNRRFLHIKRANPSEGDPGAEGCARAENRSQNKGFEPRPGLVPPRLLKIRASVWSPLFSCKMSHTSVFVQAGSCNLLRAFSRAVCCACSLVLVALRVVSSLLLCPCSRASCSACALGHLALHVLLSISLRGKASDFHGRTLHNALGCSVEGPYVPKASNPSMKLWRIPSKDRSKVSTVEKSSSPEIRTPDAHQRHALDGCGACFWVRVGSSCRGLVFRESRVSTPKPACREN